MPVPGPACIGLVTEGGRARLLGVENVNGLAKRTATFVTVGVSVIAGCHETLVAGGGFDTGPVTRLYERKSTSNSTTPKPSGPTSRPTSSWGEAGSIPHAFAASWNWASTSISNRDEVWAIEYPSAWTPG